MENFMIKVLNKNKEEDFICVKATSMEEALLVAIDKNQDKSIQIIGPVYACPSWNI